MRRYDRTSIYVVALSQNRGGYNLFSVNPDGSGREEVVRLFFTSNATSYGVYTYYDSEWRYDTVQLSTAQEEQLGYTNTRRKIWSRLSAASAPLIWKPVSGIVCYGDGNRIVMIEYTGIWGDKSPIAADRDEWKLIKYVTNWNGKDIATQEEGQKNNKKER